MEKYFYKLVSNIDFVWKIKIHNQDPYRQGEMDFGHYVCNQRVFNPYIFESLADFEQREFLSDYKEIFQTIFDSVRIEYDIAWNPNVNKIARMIT